MDHEPQGLIGEGRTALGADSDSRNDSESEIPSGADVTLAATLEEFLNLVRSGRRPSREEFLARHALQGPALAECLDGLEFLLSAAPALADPGPGEDQDRGEVRLAPASRLGDYRIVRELGRGGMGVVYEAEQISLGRRVALKVLPFGASLDPRQRQRFQLEAQAAAHLHHPHIVPVFAVGRENGVHFYAMQYIEGRSLAAILSEFRNAGRSAVLPGEPVSNRTPDSQARSSGLGPSHGDRPYFRAVAHLGRQAAEALEHAHALGVIHRDVKPGNLLIDPLGDLWVADFGLARFLDDPGPTRTGDLLGTLAYMSPEQAVGGGAVDCRSDVYSLGATLYELLTLRPPFTGRDRQEILRQIAQDEPVFPRRLTPGVPRDLETIVLKALEKEPSARYSSARVLAEDLGRFLEDKPILARRPGLGERAARWARRHRGAVTTAAVVVIGATLIGAGLLYREKQETERALERVRLELDRQRGLVASSMRAADQITYAAMGQLQQLNPKGGGEGGGFYRAALRYYEDVAAQDWEDPVLIASKAAAWRRIGFIRMILRHIKKEPDFQGADAIGAYQESIRLYEQAAEAEPSFRLFREDRFGVIQEFAAFLRETNGPRAAEPLQRQAFDLARELMAPPAQGESVANVRRWIQAAIGLSRTLKDEGCDGDALAIRSEVDRSLTEREVEATRRDAQGRGELAEARLSFARSLIAASPQLRAEAAEQFRKALAVDPSNAEVRNDLSWLLSAHPEHLPHDPEEAVKLAREVVNQEPENGNSWNTLGVALYRADRKPEAREAFEKSMDLREGGDPNDWYFMALIEGKNMAGRAWFQKAEESMAGSPRMEPDLSRFRSEAAAIHAPEEAETPTPEHP